MQYRNVFVLGVSLDGVAVDALHVFDMEQVMAEGVRKRILPQTVAPSPSIFFGMQLRSRYAHGPGGLYSVHTEEPLTREMLEEILRAKHKDGTLKTFLEEASIS